MIITFMNKTNVSDFKVAKQQRIIDVLKVLNEDTEFNINITNAKYILSTRLQEKVNTFKTFQEARIYNGDLLEIGG